MSTSPLPPEQDPAGSEEDAGEAPRVLMLGLGWFPATLGGLDRYYRSLFEELAPAARGVVLGPPGDAPAAVSVVAGPQTWLPRRLMQFWLAARSAGAEAEVVDAHFALYAAAPLLLGHLRELPSMFHFQGPWAEEALAAGESSGLKLALRRALERTALKHADAHIVLSSAFRRLLVERYGVNPWDVHVWTPGVELDVFTPGEQSQARSALELAPGAFVAVCARRLVPRMGIERLLDAWAQLAPELPPGSQLLLIGDGPLRQELQRKASAPPLAETVRLLGRVSDQDLIHAYRGADVAVVPTIAFEGFGLVVLEAAACGTPSIVTDVGGLPEVAAPLDPTLVVAPGDARALQARLRAAAAGELPDRDSTRAYAERFRWTDVAVRHRALARRLVRREQDARTRVVYVDHVARLSGGEIALLRLLPHLRAVNAHVILGEDGPFAARLQQAGISVEVLPIAPGARDLRRDAVHPGGASPAVLLSTLAYVARLTRRLRTLRPDIVHTNSLKAGVYGGLAARAAGVPLVWHARDRIAEDYLPRPAVHGVRRLVAHLADAVIANSQATLATLGAGGRAESMRWVIPDSVTVSDRRAAGGSDGMVFGMVGRIAPWKGQDLFLRAFASAFANGSERAVIVGSAMFGEDDFGTELRRIAGELGIADRVEFRGFREDVWGELASFDVLVHASTTPEPFGQVVLEGMAAGLPVIAPDEGGPADLISDRETGLLFRSRDRDSLAAAMRELHADPGTRARLGAAAREALAAYHPDVLAERWERVYERVLDRRSQRSARLFS